MLGIIYNMHLMIQISNKLKLLQKIRRNVKSVKKVIEPVLEE
nr:hypothetical protein [Ilyobacter polytropus]